MQSVHEFMQSYFQERGELRDSWLLHSSSFRKKFFTQQKVVAHENAEGGRRLFERDQPASIVSIDEFGDDTLVVTAEPCFDRHLRFRYHLQAAGETWRIRRQEWECFICKGNPAKRGGVCKHCAGTGWRDGGSSDT